MNPTLVRTGVVIALALALVIVVGLVRWRIARRRARVLATAPALDLPLVAGSAGAPVRILAFSSDDCTQCHRLQTPAIQRVLVLRGGSVAVMEVDAPSSPEITERYQILTLPSTVILDAGGKTHAVNYGFANSTKLLRQVDALLALASTATAV